MGTRRGTFVRMACPSSSTDSKRLPRGVRPMRAMFFRCANGRVYDVFLLQKSEKIAIEAMPQAYSTRLKTVTRFETGEKRHVPSGLNSRLPWQYTVPSRFENCRWD